MRFDRTRDSRRARRGVEWKRLHGCRLSHCGAPGRFLSRQGAMRNKLGLVLMGAAFAFLGGAAAEVIRRFTGSDRHKFCMTTLTAVPAASTRCFESLSQAQEENTNSRVYVGLHFRSAIEAGDRLGRRIGRFAFEHVLRPIASRGRAPDDWPGAPD